MAKSKKRTEQAEIVRLFAAKLRELRHSRGLTQAELARQAHITVSYITRLENAGAAPGIDLVQRLATALGASLSELLPEMASPDTAVLLKDQARRLCESLIKAADREMLLMMCPLLARLNESMNRSR